MEFCGGNLQRAKSAFYTLKKLAPRSPDLHSLRVVLSEICRRDPRQEHIRNRRQQSLVAVPPETLPDEIKNRLSAMRAQRVRGRRHFASSTMASIEHTLCQFVFSARTRGLPEGFDDRTIEAWLSDMNSRNIRATSKKSRVSDLVQYALAARVEDRIIYLLKEDRTTYKKDSIGLLKKKFEALKKSPITLATVIEAADTWVDAALAAGPDVPDGTWRRLWFGCAILALVAVRPVRSIDLRRLVIGYSFTRTPRHWRIDLAASKTGFDISGPLPEAITPLLDAAILQGAECRTQAEFDELYGRRVGLPFLSKPDGQPYSYQWLLKICIEAFGHGTHIPRTLHLSGAASRNPREMEAARWRVGHHSSKSKDDYLFGADETYLRVADEMLASEIAKLREQHASEGGRMTSRPRHGE